MSLSVLLARCQGAKEEKLHMAITTFVMTIRYLPMARLTLGQIQTCRQYMTWNR